MPRQTLQHLVDERKWEVVLPCGGIQLSVVYAHPPSCMNSSRNHLIIRILDHCNSTLLWHNMYGTYPLAVGDWKDYSHINGGEKMFVVKGYTDAKFQTDKD